MSAIDTTPMEDPAKAAAERLRLKLLSRRVLRVDHEGDQFDVKVLSVGLANVLIANLVSQSTYARAGDERLFPTSESAEAVSVDRAPLMRKLRNAAIAGLLAREDLDEIAAYLPAKAASDG